MSRLLGCRSLLVILFLGLAALPSGANPYWLFVGNLILIYIILALGLNLLIGYAGHLAFANAAMFGIGAYAAGLLQVRLGFPYWLALPSGGLIAMLLGTTLAFPALRLSGIYLAMATLGFAQFTQWVFLNWEAVTYGAGGFRVPAIDFAPLTVRSELGIYYLSWIIAVGLVVFAWNAMSSRIGRAFVAMRDGEIAAEALGVNLLRYKALAFALSGVYAGIAGGLFTGLLNFVAPEAFDLFQMIIHKAMVMVVGSVRSLDRSSAQHCSFCCSRRYGLSKRRRRSPSARSSSFSWSFAPVGWSPSAAATCRTGRNRFTLHKPLTRRIRPHAALRRASPAHRRRPRGESAHGRKRLVVVRRCPGALRRQHGGQSRRDRRHHRAQRCGQDHVAQCHLRHPQT
ncbi:MAG: branched-chain amino acid ABC transporter permease [Hyphomicrobiaceae bacterium]|nr:MAG: branched-chain amino acid ABC transporter permease [Hyphomicrobiaceae bacterium]